MISLQKIKYKFDKIAWDKYDCKQFCTGAFTIKFKKLKYDYLNQKQLYQIFVSTNKQYYYSLIRNKLFVPFKLKNGMSDNTIEDVLKAIQACYTIERMGIFI